MKRLVLAACLLVAPAAYPQHAESPHQGETARHGGGRSNLDVWKWANFLILAGLIGYYVARKGGPFFEARSMQIRSQIAEAEKKSEEAAVRSAEVDHRLIGLAAEFDAFRTSAHKQLAAEGERIKRETRARIARKQELTEQEIAAAAKSARLELKRYSAQLAVGLARNRIRERMNPQSADALVTSFLDGLERLRAAKTS